MRTLKRSVILMAICAGISLCGFSQMIEDAEIDAIVSKGIRTAQGQRNTDGSVTLPIDPSQSFDTPQRKEAAGKLKSMVLESKDSKKKLAAMRGLMKMSLYPLSKERAADLFSEVSKEDLETLRDYYASNKEYLALRMNLEILRDRSEDSEEKCGYEWDLCWVQILDGSMEELQKMPQELDRMSKSVKSESMIGKKVSLLREAVTGPKTLPAFYLAADIYNERRLTMEGNTGDLYWGTIIEQAWKNGVVKEVTAKRGKNAEAAWVDYTVGSALFMSGNPREALKYLDPVLEKTSKKNAYYEYMKQIYALSAMKIEEYDRAQKHLLENVGNEKLSHEFRIQNLAQAYGIIANSGQRVRIEEIRQTALDCGMYDWKELEMVQLAEHMDSLYGQWKNAQAVLNSSKEN